MANNQRSVPKLQPTRRSNNKESPVQHVSPAGVRRSGRTKQRVSYAESPSPSPERPTLGQPGNDVEIAVASQSMRSTRATRSKKRSQQDDIYATDEDDDDEQDHDLDDDGEWQGDEGNGEDNMDIEPTPVS
ncbi:hypothetical protein KCU89_g18079, partial [Aureobasidium melanogenum]